jgi:hypothetical protein
MLLKVVLVLTPQTAAILGILGTLSIKSDTSMVDPSK